MTKVKICGITNIEDALKAVELGADALGFVFAKSPRKVDKKIVKNIINKLPLRIMKVGVFVNEQKTTVDEIIKDSGITAVQFHGEETPEYCAEFKYRVKVIKAFRIKDVRSLENVFSYKYRVDFYLLDRFDKDSYGGTGKTFNWDLAKPLKDSGVRIILSGGLNASNAVDAINRLEPYMVDVSSGVEISYGRKDYKLLEEFVTKIKINS